MIRVEEFGRIHNEVVGALQETLKALREKDLGNYILFLADAEYNREYDTDSSIRNPYAIDNRVDGYKDDTRVSFLAQFLSLFYGFPGGQAATDDNYQRLNMELMIYTHIWEAKPFLKKLFRLAKLINGEDYPWIVEVPDMSKHNFIRNDIRSVFEANHNPLTEIIRRGFHTSLRNAFAHSEYSFDIFTENRRILLYNNKQEWELTEISFDNWSIRFVYSALLSYHFLRLTHEYRIHIPEHFSDQLVFTILHPSRLHGINPTEIRYDPEANDFSFVR